MNDPPLWWLTKDGDKACLALYLRHYSAYRYKDGRKRTQFVGPGEKVVLRTERADAVWVWRKFIDDSSKESTALCFGTNRRTKARSSYAKRIKLLMSSGLIAGITPTSIRKGSPQGILDFAFSKPTGASAEAPKADC